MQDNITEFNALVEKVALMQDCFKNNEILSPCETINPQIELLNYLFHILKTKVAESKTPEDNNKFKQTKPCRSFRNKSPKGKFKRNNKKFHSYKQSYQPNRKFKRNNRNENFNSEERNLEKFTNVKHTCQLYERREH